MKHKQIYQPGRTEGGSGRQILEIGKFVPKAELPHGVHEVILALAPIRKRVEEKYGNPLPFKLNLAEYIISHLSQGAGNLSFLAGKRYLELGCGSVLARKDKPAERAPWLCRYLHETGLLSEVVGVDKFEQKSEGFTSYRKDLGVDGELDFLETGSFHFVVANKLIEFVGNVVDDNTDSELMHSKSRIQLTAMKDELLGQIVRILVEGGLFCTNSEDGYAVFQKHGKKLVRIG